MYRRSSSGNNRKVISKSIDRSIRKGKEESENAEEGEGGGREKKEINRLHRT
jgi:hypothetical protein